MLLAEWVRCSRYLTETWDRYLLRPMRERKLLMSELVDFMDPGDDSTGVVDSGGPKMGASLQDLED